MGEPISKDLNYILNDINIEIKSGETIGIIGATGSGKTSLVSLIPRLYDACEGDVKVSGISVKNYDVETLRNAVAMVLQKNVLFSGTIRENMQWGDKNATDEEIKNALNLAQIPDLELDKYIEQGGANVSGGQKQRISLARALTKIPSILILDDTTSAVDMETEAKIQQGLNEVTDLTTTFIIAHRISSVREADLILMLDKGSIVERGTHSQLIAKRGRYYRLYQKQLGLEIADETQEAVSDVTETPSL